MSSTISVVIPCYNAAAFLREAIDSALAQTRPADEVIVVDDASTDGSVEVAQSYGDRIRLLRSPNARGTGHGATANRGIMASTGAYIAFLHADDVWLPPHLEKVAGLLDRWPEAGVAFSRYEFMGARSGTWLEEETLRWDGPRDVFEVIMRHMMQVPSVSVVRRCVAAMTGGFDEGRPFLSDDLDFFARCAMRHKFMACPEITVRYRWHAGQCSANPHGTLINAARYRVRIAADVRALADMRERAAQIDDRIRMSWEEELEQAWRKRNFPGLRQMARYGLSEPAYRAVTWPYAVKSRAPAWILHAWDRCRGRKPDGETQNTA